MPGEGDGGGGGVGAAQLLLFLFVFPRPPLWDDLHFFLSLFLSLLFLYLASLLVDQRDPRRDEHRAFKTPQVDFEEEVQVLLLLLVDLACNLVIEKLV